MATAPHKEAPKEAVDEQFETLWQSFVADGSFSPEMIEKERQALRDEITALEEAITQKRERLAGIDQRTEAARNQMKVLMSAGLNHDAIISAMRVQYKHARSQASKASASSTKEIDVSAEDRELVLNNLDREGLSLSELRDRTEKESTYLSLVLKALVNDGKVEKVGAGRGSKYKLT